jgi:DNA-binding transcriptional LysR family regulator
MLWSAMAAVSITIRQVEAFRALMQRHTVTRAAEMLRISQPAMTRLIADFEDGAGLGLFDRYQGRLFPTAAARVLFEEVENAFRGLDRIAQAAEQIRSMRRGSLRIACSPALALGFLPRLVAAFTRDHEGVHVAVQEHTSRMAVEFVAGQRIDLGLLVEAIPHPAVQLERVFEAPMPCILPPGHRLAAKRVIQPADLADEVFVSFPEQSDARIAIDRVFAAHGIARRTLLEAQLAQTAIGLVECGAGVSLVDPLSAHYASGRVVVRPFEPVIQDSIFLATTSGQPASSLAVAFIRLVRESLAQGGRVGAGGSGAALAVRKAGKNRKT